MDKLKQALPLAVAVGVLSFAWIEISLNFSFHWFDKGDLGNGLGLPGNFHLVAPAAFISWAFVLAVGADMAAAVKVAISSAIGASAALVLMALAPKTADLPDFWGLAVWGGVLAFAAVALSIFDWYYTPASLAAFAVVVSWWLTTGLDNWAANGGGVGDGLASLAKPQTAGTGAFGGVLSTPFAWVFLSVLVSLLAGCVLGLLSAAVSGLGSGSDAPSGDRARQRV